jgi:hypothetical protein
LACSNDFHLILLLIADVYDRKCRRASFLPGGEVDLLRRGAALRSMRWMRAAPHVFHFDRLRLSGFGVNLDLLILAAPGGAPGLCPVLSSIQ